MPNTAQKGFSSNALKRQCHEIFCFSFFTNSSSPQAPENNIRVINKFDKFVKIFASQGAPPVSTIPGVNFATGTTVVVYTGGKFATKVNDTFGKSIF
jgi:hypothetical protein